MGNWRTARIIGTCAVDQVDWTGAAFDRTGNLAERGYDEKRVAEHLEQLAKAAPSLRCKVHLGGDYESKDVVSLISLEGGKATIGPPGDVTSLEIPEDQMQSNLLSAMFGRRGS
jgi:hypothetical protein